MQTIQTTNNLSSRAIGSMIFTGFGALWFVLGLYVRQQLSAANVAWVAGGMLALAALCTHVLRLAEPSPVSPDDAGRNRAFHTVNAAQWVAVFIVLAILRRLHLDAYGVAAIAAIVGLHLFPLARLFRNTLHYATGTALVAWAACVSWLAPVDTMQGITALGAGTILWLAAAVTMTIALYALRGSAQFADRPRVA